MNEKLTDNNINNLPLPENELPVEGVTQFEEALPILTAEDIAQREQLLTEVEGKDVTAEERAEIRTRFSDLVSTVLSWANDKEENVESVERLGGGFKNPVVMVTTAKGEQFVAKAFAEDEGLANTIKAQKELDEITSEDERLIPKSEIFNDTLFSEKAKGAPVRSLIENAGNSPEELESANKAIFAVGATLGFLHERTERPIKDVDDLTEEVADEALEDREKIHKHMEQLKIAELIGLKMEDVQAVGNQIDKFTEPDFISLVHGDPHLDNFFYENGGAAVEIVDYDDIREGDPMADLGRSLQSLRYWCEQYGADKDLETELTRSLVGGYESKRKESELIDGERELDPKRVIVYGLRLDLVQLKSFGDLREKLDQTAKNLGMTENQIVFAAGDREPLIEQGLTVEENQRLKSFRRISSDLRDALEYLKPDSDQGFGQVDDNLALAA